MESKQSQLRSLSTLESRSVEGGKPIDDVKAIGGMIVEGLRTASRWASEVARTLMN